MSIQRTISPGVGLSLALVACSPAASGTPPAPTIAQPPHAAEEVRECDPSPMQGAAEAALADVEGRGTVVLVDLASGEELVLAATEPADTAAPPASTVKPMLAAAGVRNGVSTPDETVTCAGEWQRNDVTLTCYAEHGSLGLERALATSCNVFFYDLAARLGPEAISSQFEAVGLTSMAAQIRGASPDDMKFLATAIGHGEARVQPRELAQAYRALLMSTDGDLSTVRAGMLAAVRTEEGTARGAAVSGLDVAGKTGSADDVIDDVEQTHAWFVGYAPASDPRVVVAVHVDGKESGGQVAAPLASTVLASWHETCGDR